MEKLNGFFIKRKKCSYSVVSRESEKYQTKEFILFLYLLILQVQLNKTEQ